VPAEHGDVTTVDDDDLDDDLDVDAPDEDDAVPFDQDRLDASDPDVDAAADGDVGTTDHVDVGDEPIPFDQDRLDGAPPAELDDLDVGSTDEHADLVPPAVPQVKPSRRQHRAEMKRSARRVRRVVRHIDAWSVFKVASIFIACVWGVIVLASLLIWRAAESSGSIDNTEDFVKDIGFKDFDFDPHQMFDALLSAGAVLAIASVFFVVLLTILFNLICDMTGGVRITMIEQDVADGRKRASRKPEA
jgi:Transmembrane domain of unknown function (DUF3566)